jgi:diacylglycerol kinase (ATP)
VRLFYVYLCVPIYLCGESLCICLVSLFRMQRHIIYIINPISGTRTKSGLRELIEKETKARDIPYAITPSVASGDYSFLDEYILHNKVTDIVIAGGDGTISQCIGSLMKHDVSFGIIPCGSGNGLAFTAGISKNPKKALDIIFKGEAIDTDGFMVNEQFACMLCGLGFDAKVAHDFAKQPTRGLTTYVKQVLGNFFSMKSHLFDITLDGTTISLDAFLICIANSNQFGNHVTIAPKASLRDGLLDIVIVLNQGKMNFVWQALKQVAGKNKLQEGLKADKKNSVLYFQAKKIRIKNSGGALLHIDGDPAETPDELKIEVKKHCFRLIQPI